LFELIRISVHLIALDRLSLDILKDFNSLDPESQARHIAAWSPVVCQILQGYCIFDEKTVRPPSPHLPRSFRLNGSGADPDLPFCEQFLTHLPSVYVLATDVLLTESAPEVREAVRAFFVKVGEVKGIVPKVWA
jgi:brefeldin A-inhibited guanine nucleotide-exchange protein